MPQKHPDAERIGGPGASHENRKHPEKTKPRNERSDDTGQQRIPETKPDLPSGGPARQNPGARQSEFPVSRHGMNQESDHNKHNDGGQSGHKPQKHTEAEEKQD